MRNKLLIILLILCLPFIVFADSETTINGQRGAGHIIENEGVKLRQDPILNFVGTGVNAATSAGKTVVTVTESDPLSWSKTVVNLLSLIRSREHLL
jgi:hypothetical protein